MRLRISISVLVLASFAASACGDARSARQQDIAAYGSTKPVSVSPSAGRSSPAAATSARDAWVAAADAICADLNNEFVALGGSPPTTEAGLRAFLDKFLALMASYKRQIQAIPGTYGKTGQAKELVDLSVRIIDHFTRAFNALKVGNESLAQQELTQGLSLSERSTDVALSLGLNSCALPGG